jgi:cytochrome oxidase Cu insertion factor (SCO1/SenC/PrrC family)
MLRRTLAFFACAWLLASAPVAANAAAYVPVLGTGDPAPATTLFDQTGTPRSLARIGAPAIVSFIYTRCPDPRMCPLVTAKFGRLQTLLRGTPIRLVEITLDPAYDVPSVLARYAHAFDADGARWWFLTGPPADAAFVADRFGIATERTQPGLVVHTEAVVLLASDGRIARIVDGNDWKPEQIAAEARSIAALPSNPFQRLGLRLFGEIAALCGGSAARGLPVAAIAGLFFVLLATFAAIAIVIARRESARSRS